MNDHYLWDRSGDADPEIVGLERLLRPLAHDGRGLVMPVVRVEARRASPRRIAAVALPLAASVALLVGVLWGARDGARDGAKDVTRGVAGAGAAAWRIESADGPLPRGSVEAAIATHLTEGDELSTGVASRARLELDGVGSIEMGPGTILRVGPTRPGTARLVLVGGRLRATISAAPGVFSVDTPASSAVDLGCQYTLEVDARGSGVLHVTLGWVGLLWKGRESLVPAGALCATRAARGPGTPFFEGATPALVQALARLDAGVDAERDAAVTALLKDARPLDAITLWHLLTRMDRANAGRVYDRLAELMPPPASVSRDRVLTGDASALAAWWEALGLGDLAALRAGLRGSYR